MPFCWKISRNGIYVAAVPPVRNIGIREKLYPKEQEARVCGPPVSAFVGVCETMKVMFHIFLYKAVSMLDTINI